jgi:hypothetical protein
MNWLWNYSQDVINLLLLMFFKPLRFHIHEQHIRYTVNWIDLEMTGLDTDNDQIIEVATIITDDHLNILAEGPVLAASARSYFKCYG